MRRLNRTLSESARDGFRMADGDGSFERAGVHCGLDMGTSAPCQKIIVDWLTDQE